MTSLNLLSMKAASSQREHDERQRMTRHRNALVLILDYLKEMAFFETADALLREAKAIKHDISNVTVCDNMDLASILLEYECNYVSRLQKKPKFIREIPAEEMGKIGSYARKKSVKDAQPVSSRTKHSEPAPDKLPDSNSKSDKSTIPVLDFPEISCVKIENSPKPIQPDHGDTERFNSSSLQSPTLGCVTRLKAALDTYETKFGPELYELAVTIGREMFVENPNVQWDDIKGMDDAKRLVKEAVVYPVKYPDFFQGILTPWRGLLLTGPPGTGKTMLAKAVATECQTAFFNITASTVVSKWRGESEKLIRVLFDLARKCAPTCIFLDELDSLMGHRGENNEHEGSRRMKTEILIQMDGLQRSTDVVFVLAASNLPWELDSAMIRRLEKRVFVDLPSADARQAMFQSYLPAIFSGHPLGLTTQLDYPALAELTAGYSGSDIHGLCKEAAMRAIRKVLNILNDDNSGSLILENLSIKPIVTSDVRDVLQYIRPVETERGVAKYREWQKQYSAC